MYLYYMYINMTSLASEEIEIRYIDNSIISPDPCARLGRKG